MIVNEGLHDGSIKIDSLHGRAEQNLVKLTSSLGHNYHLKDPEIQISQRPWGAITFKCQHTRLQGMMKKVSKPQGHCIRLASIRYLRLVEPHLRWSTTGAKFLSPS